MITAGVSRGRTVTLLRFESLVGPRHRSLFACCSTSGSNLKKSILDFEVL